MRFALLRHFREHLMRGGDGFVNQLGRVRGGDKARFIGGRAEGGVAVEHAVEEAFEGVDIGTRHVAVILRGVCGEIQAEHTAHAVGGELDAVCFGGGGKPVGEAAGQGGQVFVEAFALDDFKRFQACGDGNRVA